MLELYKTFHLVGPGRPVSAASGSRSLRSTERGFWWSHLPVHRLCRTTHSLWRALGFGMISLKSCASSLDYVPIHFYVIWKPDFLSALELGAFLSSYLEGALYTFLNEWMHEVSFNMAIVSLTERAWACLKAEVDTLIMLCDKLEKMFQILMKDCYLFLKIKSDYFCKIPNRDH